ncbi:MAG TPA: glycosyltransferase [Terriglobales bacterium]|nr:glycosyltransferase [Terriglobales bacterium]
MKHKGQRDLLTVILEDYFHVGALSGLISSREWYRFETRFEKNTLKTLDFLKQFDVQATFFVLGWIAEKHPELIAEVARQGHEVANYGFHHKNVRQMTREEFREDARRSRDAIEIATGKRVIGYRMPQGLHSPSDFWILDTLAEEGYVYDSSVFPSSQLGSRFREVYEHQNQSGRLWEFPHATLNLLGYRLPISGGNYFRQIPHTLLKHAVSHWKEQTTAPLMIYFHVWELDPEQPRISATSWLTRTRQYRNLNKMQWVLRDYFSKYKFGSVADYLGCDTQAASVVGRRPVLEIQTGTLEPPVRKPAVRTPVTVVVPCYNERPTLPYLANTLESVTKLLDPDFDLSFIFVDDRSTDGTPELLQRLFGNKPNCRIVEHPQNLGVAAAIFTGIRHAQTEVVCSIDCDCSYDPHELMHMIPMLTQGVDMVTASPYHPQGKVTNVPSWRLTLSKGASWLYGKVLRHKLATYTSCFRVYRRSKVVDLQLSEPGYLGVAEILALIDLRGGSIKEFPTTLHVRILGQSKMKVARTVVGHLKNLRRFRQMRVLLDRTPSLAVTKHESAAQPSTTHSLDDSHVRTLND